jgi:glutaminyl-tRNA synthetase
LFRARPGKLRWSPASPPEPNGYLHIGHAKAICLDFGMAASSADAATCAWTTPIRPRKAVEYVENIKTDVRWLGFDWGEHFYYSADYFERMYEVAEDLIRKGKAYVCELSQDQWKEYRGVPTRPGKESPVPQPPAGGEPRPVPRMRAGEFADGTLCLRAKIDMASPNMHLRDPGDLPHHARAPLPHRRHVVHLPDVRLRPPAGGRVRGRHPFAVHAGVRGAPPAVRLGGRPTRPAVRPHQFEFARLNLTYTVMSKRKLLQLVQREAGQRLGRPAHADDLRPAPPRLSGEAIRNFCEVIGITKFESLTDVALLEHCVRDVLNKRRAPHGRAATRSRWSSRTPPRCPPRSPP